MNTIFGPDRRSIRLAEYDYASEGLYYVTLCTYDRRHILGKVKEGEMNLSSIGEMVQKGWRELPRYDPRISLDESIVMPNHLHGIIVIDRNGLEFHCGRARGPAPTNDPLSLPDLMQRFKSWTTRQYLDTNPSLRGLLWQRNYYEHIIRNDTDLSRIREYIRTNPQNWDDDPENPALQ